jgi:voltage-gated sodium channel
MLENAKQQTWFGRLIGILEKLIKNPWFERSTTVLIILNTLTICIGTYHADIEAFQNKHNLPIERWFDLFDVFVIIIFSIEVSFRLITMGRKFWNDKWNIFDLIIVSVSLVGQSPFFTVLRVLRTIRALRLLTRFKTLRLISSVIWHSVTGCAWISVLMVMVLMIFAIIRHDLYGETNPALFGNLHLAMHTLFRVAALYSYDDVVSQLVGEHPYVYLFLIPYFIVMGYIVINFFSGIVIYYLYEVSLDELKAGERELSDDKNDEPINHGPVMLEVLTELRHLRHEVAKLKEEMK